MDKGIEKVRVELGAQSYNIYLGSGILGKCIGMPGESSGLPDGCTGASSGDHAAAREVFVISDTNVYPFYGARLEALLRERGYQPAAHIIAAGEASKTWAQAEIILAKMLAANLSRSTPVIALGGGVVGDLAGFVAALYKRGAPLVQAPTTLLAQVDSSIGGKVAVNHALAKNMLGTFYQPRAVWADLETLETLPQEEWLAGLAEVCKYALLGDAEFFFYLEELAYEIKARRPEVLLKMIARCARIKAEIVAQDERDEGTRNLLNLGHTIGHALEGATAFQKYRHGEAVAVGMIGAVKLAKNLGLVGNEVVARVEGLLTAWELPVRFPGSLVDAVLAHLYQDKKMIGKQLVFILPDALGHTVIRKGVSETALKQVLEELSNN